MPDGGTIGIQTRNVVLGDDIATKPRESAPGPNLLLTVKDSGLGITPAVREHMFEPFFTTKEPGAGTGLGLSIVCEIVKQSNGSIDVKSEPGKGTTFYVYLPRTEARTHTAVLRHVQKPHPRGES